MPKMKSSALVLVLAAFSALFVSASAVFPQAAEQSDEASAFAPIPAVGVDLSQFVWKNRLVVVFANSPQDPAFIEQMRLLEERWADLLARDVVVITDTDPAVLSPVRKTLRPRGFSLVLIEKDGRVELRKPLPWDGREIMRAIDKMPIRREELRNAPTGQSPAVGG